MKAIFALPMDGEELEIFKRFTGRQSAPSRPYKEVFLIMGRRSGKTRAASLLVTFLSALCDWKDVLGPGEKGYIMLIAADRRQCRVVLDYIRAFFRLPMLRSLVISELKEEIELSNNVVISVQTASYRTSRNFTILALIADEAGYWRVEGANPASEIIRAIRPGMATVEDSKMIFLSSPYGAFGPLYEAYKEKFGTEDPDTLVVRVDSKTMNPTLRDSVIARAFTEDPESARSEYGAEFRHDVSQAFPSELIEAAVVHGRWQLPPVDGLTYFAFCDPAGGAAEGDSFTLAITHEDKETRQIIVDRIEEKRAPFFPRSVVKEFSEILLQYQIREVTGDRYAGTWPSSIFLENGISYIPSELDKSKIYLNAIPLLAQKEIALLDSKKLCQQFRGLERKTRSGGADTIDHYPNESDDIVNSVCGALLKARNSKSRYVRDDIIEINRPRTLPSSDEENLLAREAEVWLLDLPPDSKRRMEIEEEKKLHAEIDAELKAAADELKENESVGRTEHGWGDKKKT